MASPTNRAYKGRLMLIKVAQAGVSPTAYDTLMGVRSRTITINNEMVNITDSDNAPLRHLLDDAGERAISITANGVHKDDTAMQMLEDLARGVSNRTIDSFLFQFANGDTLEGEFQVTSHEEAGEHNGEVTFSVTLESASAWSFVRA